MNGREFVTAIVSGIGAACVGLLLGVLAAAAVFWSLNTLTGRHHQPCTQSRAAGDQ
jgi:hypothetical protein